MSVERPGVASGEPTILDALRGMYPSLTTSERRIADSVLAGPQDVVHESGRELARRSGTTETVLFGLVRKLGIRGFKAFKLGLLREEATAKARAELGTFNVEVDPGSPFPAQIEGTMRSYASNLEATGRLLRTSPVDEVAEAIASASLVTLLGLGASLSVATLAENVLARLGVPVRLSLDSHQQLLQSLLTWDRHVVVAFSFSGETRETVEALAVARHAGARTIVVTAFVPSAASRLADHVIRVPIVNPHRYRVGLVDAVLPYLVVIDLLAVRIGAGRAAIDLRDRVEAVIERRKLRSSGIGGRASDRP